MDWLNWFKLPDILKIQTRYWLGAFVVLTAVLFVPDSVATAIGVDALRRAIRPYLGIALIIASTVVSVQAGTNIFGWIQTKRTRSQAMKTMKERLHRLTPDE